MFGSGAAEIQNFDQLDSLEVDSRTYMYEVSFELVYLKSSVEILDALQRAEEENSKSGIQGLASGLEAMLIAFSLGDFEAGHRTSIGQNVKAQRWENGWRLIEDK